jgi:hypothetical protein
VVVGLVDHRPRQQQTGPRHPMTAQPITLSVLATTTK